MACIAKNLNYPSISLLRLDQQSRPLLIYPGRFDDDVALSEKVQNKYESANGFADD